MHRSRIILVETTSPRKPRIMPCSNQNSRSCASWMTPVASCRMSPTPSPTCHPRCLPARQEWLGGSARVAPILSSRLHHFLDHKPSSRICGGSLFAGRFSVCAEGVRSRRSATRGPLGAQRQTIYFPVFVKGRHGAPVATREPYPKAQRCLLTPFRSSAKRRVSTRLSTVISLACRQIGIS
jgi:hypothetical protein